MSDYKVTINVNEKDYETWKRFLTIKNVKTSGINSSLVDINAKTFTRAINKIMCANGSCDNCKQCDYDFELDEAGLL